MSLFARGFGRWTAYSTDSWVGFAQDTSWRCCSSLITGALAYQSYLGGERGVSERNAILLFTQISDPGPALPSNPPWQRHCLFLVPLATYHPFSLRQVSWDTPTGSLGSHMIWTPTLQSGTSVGDGLLTEHPCINASPVSYGTWALVITKDPITSILGRPLYIHSSRWSTFH